MSRWLRRGRLSVRIGLAILGLVGFVTLAQGSVLSLVFFDQAAAVRERLAQEAVALSQLAAHGDLDAETLARDVGSLEHLRIGLYDAEGARLGASHPDARIRRRLDDATRVAALAQPGRPLYLTAPAPGEPTDFVVALSDSPRVRFLSLYEDSAPHGFPTARSRVLVGALLVALLIALALTWIIARRVRTTIQTTERAVRRMADGDLSVRLEESGDDELGSLVRDFNRMAEKLARHVARLEGEDERRKALFAAFTHEINTPLTAVLGYLESLRMADIDGDAETRRRYVSVAYDQARQLDALADDLTTLSKLDYDGLTLEREHVSLRRIAEGEADAVQPRASARRIVVRVLGDATPCDVDRGRIAQVVRNLLDNAVRHGRPDTEVVVESRVEGPDATLEVLDHGEGIAAEQLPHLGTPLHRVGTARSRADGGRGLGLAIARGIVRAHGGSLEIRSTPQVGTSVEVRLPGVARPG